MPQMKLLIGQMDLESDHTAKKDEVIAHLYNGYRVSNSIYSIPGYTLFCDLGTGTGTTIDGDYYSTLYDIRIVCSAGRAWTDDSQGIATELEGVSLTTGVPVSFTEDNNAIYFAAKSRIHKYADSVTLMTGQAPVGVTSLAYIKGFLLAVGNDSSGGAVPGDVWYSDDATHSTWEVFNNELLPDAVETILATFSEVYAVGRESMEVNQIGSDTSNPFENNAAASQPIGTMAPYSVAFDQESIYYLTTIGGCRRIVRLVGGRTKEIISFAVDVPIDDIEDVTDARGWIQSWKGQTFYVITFPTAQMTIADELHDGVTFAFNLKTKEWYIWYRWEQTQGKNQRYPADTFLYIEPWGKRFVGFDGCLWELGGHQFNNVPVRMCLRTGNRSWGRDGQEKISVFYSYDWKFGVGNSDIASPVMLHRWRNNGNMEWSNPRSVELGAVGVRTGPKRSWVCGRYYTRQDEFIFADPCEVVLNGIWEEEEVLAR